jgi:transcriptional regulator with XRE-family HTH domain
MNEFGRRLCILRERRHLSYESLSEAVGITKSLLWRYEKGKSEPGLTALRKLADYFAVTLDWLAGNGDFNNIKFANKTEYSNAIDKCIKEDISPDKLERIIDVMKD